MQKSYRIGELARDLSVPIETIRYYEREGLLKVSVRTAGNYRLYSERERSRLEFILHCRALDMTHHEIRRLLGVRDKPEQGCAEVNALLDEHISHVAGRIQALKKLQSELKILRGHCGELRTSQDCGILQELAKPGSGKRGVKGSRMAVC